MENYEKVKAILQNHTEKDLSHLTLEMTLQGDLGLSSLDVVNLVMEFEDAFNIEISDEDLAGFVTVGDILSSFQFFHLPL